MTKQEILDYLDNVLHPIVSPDNWNVYSELYDMIEKLPSAELVRHGKWVPKYIKICGQDWASGMKCSECGEDALNAEGDEFLTYYCPNCGARMDEE